MMLNSWKDLLDPHKEFRHYYDPEAPAPVVGRDGEGVIAKGFPP